MLTEAHSLIHEDCVNMRTTSLVFSVGLACLVAGCGKKDPFNKQPVSGSVSLKGKPVANGALYFEPSEGQGTATNVTVTNGTFALTKETGLSPGKYVWRLNVFENAGGEGGGADTGRAMKNLVPEKENGKTFEVKEGDNKLDIAIP